MKRNTTVECHFVGLDEPVKLELAVGSRAVEFKELNKDVASKKTEDEKMEIIKDIVVKFSNISKEAISDFTDVEIMDMYFTMQGDAESTKKMLSLSK